MTSYIWWLLFERYLFEYIYRYLLVFCRLSKKRIELIVKHSSHIRSTCNMNIKYSTEDYFRAKLAGFPLFDSFAKRCQTYEFVNITGKTCSGCTVGTWQPANEHLHINPHYSTNAGCQFGGAGAGFRTSIQMFGLYKVTDPSFGCTSSAESTTQYWLGSKFN